MLDQKNLIMMIIFSVVIIFGFQVFFAAPEKKAQNPGTAPVAAGNAGKTGTAGKTGILPGTANVAPRLARTDAIKSNGRILIRTLKLSGSISLKGAVVDDLTLLGYWQTIKNEKHVDLLNPARSKDAYFVEFGWYNGADAKPILSSDDVWSVNGNRELKPNAPVTLVLKKAGLEFRRTFKIDKDYMISVTQAVKNVSASSVKLFPFSRIRLLNEPETQGFFILHEGPLAVHRKKADERGVQEEPSYSDIREKQIEYDSVGGWLGFTSHYWLVALIPNQKGTVKGRFSFEKIAAAGEGKGWFKAEYFGVIHTLEPGRNLSVDTRLFAGAKESNVLKRYQDKDGIDRFEWAIDWGWFWFFTKPFLWLLKWFFGWVGNFGVAIILLTVLVKLIFFPLANRSYKSMSKMKKLQPELVKLRGRFADDKQRINQEMMALYRKEKVNPAAGCLPIILQIPVFFALYKVLFVAIEMRHAPFFGWVQDLSAKDPTSIINLFGLLPFTAPTGGIAEFISIGIWPIIMGTTMFLQQKLNPAPTDPIQQKVFMFLPFIFTFMLASFPAGLVIYWACNNTLSIAQQWTIMRQQGVYKTGGTGPTNVRDLETTDDNGGGGGGGGDDDGANEESSKKGPVKPAANTRANPGRSKQSRNKPPASKSRGRKPRARSGSRPKR